MTKNNLSERDEICLCPKQERGYWTIEDGAKVYKTFEAVRYHRDDCPFFEDNSHAERESDYSARETEYVF